MLKSLSYSLAAALLLGLSAPDIAFAQSDEERAGARAAATEGSRAFNEGNYAEALDLFTRAEAIIHSPTHLLFIARAQVKLGQLVRGRETYLKLGREVLAPDAPAAFVNAKEEAKKDLTALDPRIPYVSVSVQGAAGDPVVVNMDGVQIPPTLVGIPRPVDPGEHQFQAFSKGLESEVLTVSVKEGTRQSVALVLKPASVQAGENTDVTPGSGAEGEADGEGSGAGMSFDSSSSNANIPMYVSFGVGAVGIAAGAFFLLQSSSKRSEADDLCGAGQCPADKRADIQQLDDDASAFGTYGIIGLGVGAVGVGAGIYFLLTGDSDSASAAWSGQPERASKSWTGVRPFASLNGAGVYGRF